MLAPTAPIVLLEIEGKRLSRDLTDRLVSFVYEDHETALDLLEVTLADPYLLFIDDPLLQEGNDIRARFGYADNLSPTKLGVIKEIGYDFPESGAPTITIKAYDKGCNLSTEQVLRVWEMPGGIRASDIAITIANEHGLVPVVTPTVDRFPRRHQSKQSDAQFLRALAKIARATTGNGVTGYAFYVEGEELHFHPRGLEKPPVMVLEYFTSRDGILRSFRPQTQTQGAATSGKSTTAVGVDPKAKAPVVTKADDATTPERPVLGKKSVLTEGAPAAPRVIDANTGKRVR
ncbi:MAG: Phage late control gene D protein (GPD) [bacterium ADurb.Bin429]|nr:MAG: Phage late control gene D protein (GPD) [bacterium ADurb.Bin429]